MVTQMSTDRPGAEVLDAQALEKMSRLGGSGDGEFFRRLIERFVDATPARLDAIEHAWREAAAQDLELNAHSLKSSAGYLGVIEMVELSRELERMGRAGEFAGAEEKIARLREVFAIAAAALHKLL